MYLTLCHLWRLLKMGKTCLESKGGHCREVSVTIWYAHTLKSCPLPLGSPVLRGPEGQVFTMSHVVGFGYAGQGEFWKARLSLKATLFKS